MRNIYITYDLARLATYRLGMIGNGTEQIGIKVYWLSGMRTAVTDIIGVILSLQRVHA